MLMRNAKAQLIIPFQNQLRANDGSKYLAKKKLGDALQLKYDHKFFYICRDHKTNLEHLFSGKDILDHGFFSHLQGLSIQSVFGF